MSQSLPTTPLGDAKNKKITTSDGLTFSKNLLSMKFMRRKEEAEMRAKLEEEAQKQLQESQWVVPGREHYVLLSVEEKNYVFSRKTGRRSFGGFNPAVENLIKQQTKEEKDEEKKIRKAEEQEEKMKIAENPEPGSMPDTEMVERFQSITSEDKFKRPATAPDLSSRTKKTKT